MKPDMSVVIPAYNEEANVPLVLSAINEFRKTADFNAQFVFVDDGSTDKTSELLRKAALENEFIKFVRLSRNFGAHAALRAGIFNADADLCSMGTMDLADPLESIKKYYFELTNGYDIVYSERVGYRGSLGSRIFASLVCKYIEPTYPREGLMGIAFGKKVKDELNGNIENNSSIYFQIFQMGFRKLAVPVQFHERSVGKSKWTLMKKVKLFIDSFAMFSFAPIRMISVTGLALAAIGFIWMLWIIIQKVFGLFDYMSGWPTLMSILLIGFGITNVSLGVIAEYLVRTLDAARKRPTFIVDSVYMSGQKRD